ncbi:biotin transporter BioY [Candidatus Liberibacter africanus]|uniref:Biotin transporter n=1 Tax=Candidatus Liberibacter africanus PTSAPSY TaxID=1277257 RepID=A0A0G3I303_LIBAF|nr:biotin transporter BioY [Candidatus Liberibacter africanus]AKK20269.1 BioY protein [Candidatus Liberibacter africanus PTSAPSY]QTP64032.1 biotin transporter BioY [Candidatus Liberibacter africanus]
MSNSFESIIKPAFNLTLLKNRSLAWKFATLIFGNLFLILSSYIVVPMIPVPMTMQTFAVTLIGAVYGWRFGGMMVIIWLIEGALGLPVLAGGAGGIHCFVGATAGYIFSFPIAAFLMGWLSERGWNGNRVFLAFSGMLISNTLVILFGAGWLATLIGYKPAIILGLKPFLTGAVIRSFVGALTMKFLMRTEKT